MIFNSASGTPFNGIAPSPASTLGTSFDPEGLVVHPVTGNLIVSDEYAASVYEFTRGGNLVRQYVTPENIRPTTSHRLGVGDGRFIGAPLGGRLYRRTLAAPKGACIFSKTQT